MARRSASAPGRDAHRQHGDRHRRGTTEIAVIALSGIVSTRRSDGVTSGSAIVQFMRKNYNLLIGEPTRS